MTGSVVPIGDRAHEDAMALLPWYANDSLEGEDLRMVELHLRQCARCQRELAFQRELLAAYQAIEPASEVDRAFARVRGRIERDGWRERLARTSRGVASAWRGTRPWARWLVASEFAVIVALAIGLGAILREGGGHAGAVGPVAAGATPAAAGEYRLLGADRSSRPLASAMVEFAASATMADVQRALAAVHARVVDGPLTGGAYLVEFSRGDTAGGVTGLRSAAGVLRVQALEVGSGAH